MHPNSKGHFGPKKSSMREYQTACTYTIIKPVAMRMISNVWEVEGSKKNPSNPSEMPLFRLEFLCCGWFSRVLCAHAHRPLLFFQVALGRERFRLFQPLEAMLRIRSERVPDRMQGR
jgi:hypothetical protein